MINNWQTKKLGEICEIELGKTPYRGNRNYWDPEKKTDNIWLSIADLLNTKDNIIYDSNEYISNEGAKLSKIVKKGTLLTSFKLTLGRLAFTGKDLYTNEAIASLTIKNEKEVLKNYLYHFLMFFDWDGETKGDVKVKGKTLNKAKLKEILIIFPKSLAEQQRIVKILDETFNSIAKAKSIAEKNLQNSKDVFDSYLQDIFLNFKPNWKFRRLGDVCDTGAGGTPLKAHRDYYDDGNIPWLRSGEVDKKNILKSELFITEKGMKNSSARLFPKNTVLVAMYGATAGQVGILRFESTTNQAVCGILPNENFLPEFIYYVFTAGKANLIKQAVGGAQPNISQIKIKDTLIPVFPTSEQRSLVTKLDLLEDETKKLEAIYQQKLADLEELKKSILNKAFNGEL